MLVFETIVAAAEASPKLEYARAHAENGRFIFPTHWTDGAGNCSCGSPECDSPGKHPLGAVVPRGHRDATDDLFQVEYWWDQYPEANIALVPGRSGLLVLDADCKEGKVGLETLAELEREYPVLKEAPRVRTPSGGIHVYLRLPEGTAPIGNTSPFKDVDVRAHSGYVMAIGSVIGGKAYEPISGSLDTAPAGLLARLGAARERISGETELKRQATDTELMRAAEAIPNDDLDWEEWNKFGLAFFAASGGEDGGLAAFLAWSAKSGKFDEGDARDRWAHYFSSPPDSIGWGFLQAQTVGYEAQADAPGAIERLKAKAGEQDDDILMDDDGPRYPDPDRLLCDAAAIVVSGIERRRPVYFGCFADYLSTTVAMSGLGKSALETALAVSVAAGKPLLGGTVRENGPVIMFNAEDRLDEMQRKVAAVCKAFGVQIPKERLYLFSGRDFGDNPLLFAQMHKGDFAVNTDAFTWLSRLCERIKPLLLVMEPFGDLHALPENDNALIRRLVRALANRIVEPHRLALETAHHTSKTAGVNADVTQAASRGAQALIDASRTARVLTKATTSDLKALKIDIAGGGRVVSASNAKLSFLPPTSVRDWFSLDGVMIDNGEEIQALRPIPAEHVRPTLEEAPDAERMRIYGETLAGIARDRGWAPGTGISYWKASGLLLEHAQKLEERGELTPMERLRCGLARDRSNLQKSLVKNFGKISAGDILVVNRQDQIKFLEG